MLRISAISACSFLCKRGDTTALTVRLWVLIARVLVRESKRLVRNGEQFGEGRDALYGADFSRRGDRHGCRVHCANVGKKRCFERDGVSIQR